MRILIEADPGAAGLTLAREIRRRIVDDAPMLRGLTKIVRPMSSEMDRRLVFVDDTGDAR